MQRSNSAFPFVLACFIGGMAVLPPCSFSAFAQPVAVPAATPPQHPVGMPEDGLLSLPKEGEVMPSSPVTPPVTPVPLQTIAPAPPAQPNAPLDYYGAPERRTPATVALPDVPDNAPGAEDTRFQPSSGAWPYSIMYPAAEIANLKNILALYERKGFIIDQAAGAAAAQSGVDELYRSLQEKPLPANLVYPSFKLRSIVYRAANEWSVWLNNRHITNMNNRKDGEITVLHVNRESAEFAWIPTNAELLSAILQLRLLPEDVRPKTTETPRHRKAVGGKRKGWLDTSTSVVHFVLRPNQTFSSETFEIFEGVPAAMEAGVNRAIQLETEPDSATAAPEGDPDKIITDLQQQLGGTASPGTSEQTLEETAGQKQSPKAQIIRALGLDN